MRQHKLEQGEEAVGRLNREHWSRRVTVAGLAIVAALAGCATNPVTGRRELSLISEAQEIQMGKQAAQGDLQRLGELPSQPLRDLVRTMGLRMAAQSERPQLPWEFHVLDDAAVNAFAYPGGFIFVTRGLLTHLNSEAELAEVVGHEIGHVTAKHSVVQMSQAQAAQIGLVGASIFSSTVAKYSDVLGGGAGLLFLKFGRDDELQADDLGFRYSLAQGYDVREAPKVFTMLGRLSGGGGRVPEWQSTHPDPGNRAQLAQRRVASKPDSTFRSLRINRDGFLRLLDGMVYGENPRQGYFRGTRFLHPDGKFQLDFPTGWQVANLPDAVVGMSPDKGAQLQLSYAQGTPAQAAQAFASQQGITVRQRGSAPVNGLPAEQVVFDAQTQQGVVQGQLVTVAYGGTTYALLGIMAPAAAARAPEVDAASRSFRALTDPAALNVQPARLQLVTLDQAMTGAQFAQRHATGGVTAETLYLINNIDATTALPKGMVLKRVVSG
ncbi:MAG: M48 family metalloprotease [Gemmatimonadetes bacterium]|nr:M48 family metalloprotease [Gemmatimonadota bacterium]